MTTPPDSFSGDSGEDSGGGESPPTPAGPPGFPPADPAAERTEIIPTTAAGAGAPGAAEGATGAAPGAQPGGAWSPRPDLPAQPVWSGHGRVPWPPEQPVPGAGYPAGPTDVSAGEPFFTDPPPEPDGGRTTELRVPHPGQSLFGGPADAAVAHPGLIGGSSHGERDADVLAARRRRPLAERGWRRLIAKMTGGRINPGPSAKQEQRDELLAKIRSSLTGVNKVAFLSAKGGVGKTTMTVALGSMIARERGDRVIAVDVNTDLGDLAARFAENGGAGANIEHLASLRDSGRYARVREHTVQNTARLEALSSQNDPRSSYTLSAQDYAAAMRILETHYNVILLDCGTAITAPLFTAIADDVTTLVVVASQTTRGVTGARNTLEWLHSHGYGRLLPHTIVALNATDRGKPLINIKAADTMFRQAVPEVVEVPYDPHLAEGVAVDFEALRSKTRKALLTLAGAVADHYPVRRAAVPQHEGPRGF